MRLLHRHTDGLATPEQRTEHWQALFSLPVVRNSCSGGLETETLDGTKGRCSKMYAFLSSYCLEGGLQMELLMIAERVNRVRVAPPHKMADPFFVVLASAS